MNPDTLTVPDLEELLDEEIPCQGILQYDIARSCTRAAVLTSRGHGCREPVTAFNKCIPCWQIWYRHKVGKLANRGFLCCAQCRQKFTSVEAFSDYRPL